MGTKNTNPVLDLLSKTKATQAGFAEIVGVTQPAIQTKVGKVLRHGGSFLDWVRDYCENQRAEAAGRSGKNQDSLTLARTEESKVKAANLRLDYQTKLGNLILVDDSVEVLSDWADYANRESETTTEKLIHEIESKYNINVDPDLVVKISGPASERIASYAQKLGAGLVERSKGIQAA